MLPNRHRAEGLRSVDQRSTVILRLLQGQANSRVGQEVVPRVSETL